MDFYEFKQKQPLAQTQIKTLIDLIDQYCQVLRTNYQSHSIEIHRQSISTGVNVEYHQEQIDKLCMGEGVDQFVVQMGRKYAKIVRVCNFNQHQSAHAFVDLTNGDVYKSASWKSPAKGIRYNLLDEQSRTEMYQRADWAGSYLHR
jgi:hypothetical protein